uniref:Yip1 domain-containing protein n=1 Tax=Candidatus Methanophaga sp. ANME-1 ERB7 TaxID=2759913 RepID=A0A7G9ZDH5_9EURY|nr:hypothetical protein IGEJHNFM_00025 [Methanosarcinales archaeon ANME-1 ERB7]
MVLSIGERIKGFLFSPSETFDASKEDSLGDAFKYYIVILLILAVLVAIIGAVAFQLIWGRFAAFLPPDAPSLAGMGPLLAVAIFIAVLVGGIIGAFIDGLWIHLWVYIVGGRNGVGQTIKAVLYGATPYCLLGWIPIVNFIAEIWMIIVAILGVRQLHEISTGKAVLAVILAIIIPAIIIGAIIASVMSAMPQGPMCTWPKGPGLGGI